MHAASQAADPNQASNQGTLAPHGPGQGSIRATNQALEFDYGRGVAVPSDVVGELETEVKSGGPINMELYVHLRVRYKFELFKMREKPEVRCWLSFPVKEGRGPGVGGVEASGDQCSFKYSR